MFFFQSVLSLYLVVVGYILPVAETWHSENSEESLWGMWLGIVALEGFAVPLTFSSTDTSSSGQAMLVRCAYLTVIVFDLLGARKGIVRLTHLLRDAAVRFLESRLCSPSSRRHPPSGIDARFAPRCSGSNRAGIDAVEVLLRIIK